jgi:F-type H+-transporting ATPase subunit b
VLRSAFDLTEKQKEDIQKALNETFHDEIKLRFQVDGDLVGGIELASNGQKIAWNIADYLKTMEKIVDDSVGNNP